MVVSKPRIRVPTKSWKRKLPASVYYIPEFITKEVEETLIRQVGLAPKPKWTQLSSRRLQNWGGLPHPKGMIPENMPGWLECIIKKVAETFDVFEKLPNHVLVNEYLPGQGIMPHEDGPLYYPVVSNITLGSHGVLDFYHPIKSESSNDGGDVQQTPGNMEDKDEQLHSPLKERYMGSLLLEQRSLFLMTEDMYRNYLHGIEEKCSDVLDANILNLDRCSGVQKEETLTRGTRISLTIRNVPKVLKTKIFLSGKK